MIEFTCPGCLSQCVANGAFSGMNARCVVCGAFIRIPEGTGETAFPLGAIPSGPLPENNPRRLASSEPSKSGGRPPGSGLSVLDDPDTDDEFLDSDIEEDDPDADVLGLAADEEGKPKKRKARQVDGLDGSDSDLMEREGSDSDERDTERYSAAAADAAKTAAKADEKKARRRRIAIIGGSVGAAIVITVILAFTRGEKPKLPPAPDTPAPAPLPPPPPPKKEEKIEPPPPPLAVAPPPRETGEPLRFVASQLLAVRTLNPAAFDDTYRGRLMLIRGTYARTTAGAFFLAESSDDTSFIVCAPPKLTKKPSVEPPPEASLLQAGQAVIVRGWYSTDLRLTDCRIVATSGPADDEYRNKEIELVGVVGKAIAVDAESSERFPTVVLEPPTTDCPVSVRCLFRPSERERLETLRPGQTVTIRGRCEGRSYRVVRIHDCLLVPNTDPPPVGVARVPSDRFFAAYEVDLLQFTRPSGFAPAASLTADQLAEDYGANVRRANATYQYKTVIVRGLVDRQAGQTVVFETGTSQKYRIQAAFTTTHFAALKPRKEQAIRGVCIGVVGPFVRLENAEVYDPDSANPALRTVADYLPLRPGQSITYDLLTVSNNVSNKKDHPITRLSVAVISSDLVRTTSLQMGTFPRATFFGDPAQPKWTKDLTKAKGGPPFTLLEYRVKGDTVEVRDKPLPPAQPAAWWDPVFKVGMRLGETWNSTMPDGRVVTYKVAAFGKDANDRPTVEISRITKNPMDVTSWEEATITYTLGIGGVRRVISRQFANGKAITLVEMVLVSSDIPEKKDK